MALVLLTGRAAAQTPTGVAVNNALTNDNGETLTVEVNFGIVDENGLPVAEGRPGQAQLHVDDGGVYNTLITPANEPGYIALLMDISGSMAEVADELRAAAVDAVNAAPEGTRFAVVTFDEQINLEQSFTADLGAVISAINSVQVGSGSTCLIDVAVTTIQSLEQLAADSAQRAIVLLTDGRDERTSGQGDTCSDNTADQLISLARSKDVTVPIHIVALNGENLPVNEELLNLIASETGSLVVADEEMNLVGHFQQVLGALRSQWNARADVYTLSGEHGAALFVWLEDGTQIEPGTVSFFADQDYPEPEENPVGITVTDFQYNENNDELTIEASLTDPGRVSQLRIEVWNQSTNERVDTIIYNNVPGRRQTISLDTSLLVPRGVYTARIYPLSNIGLEFQNELGQVVRAEHPFQYVPDLDLLYEIESVRVDPERQQLIVDLNIENGAALTTFTGRFFSSEDNLEVSTFGPITRVGDLVYVPLPQVGGTYQVVVNGLDFDGNLLGTTTYTFSYELNELSALDRAVLAVQENPLIWIIGLVILILLMVAEALLLWAIFRSRMKNAVEEAVAAALAAVPAPATNGAPRIVDDALAKLRLEQTVASQLIGREFAIVTVPCTLGREGSDIVISGDRQISREHAAITYQNGQFTLRDLRSSNSTYLNGQPLAADESVLLTGDDVIGLGQTTELRFVEMSAEEAEEGHQNGAGRERPRPPLSTTS